MFNEALGLLGRMQQEGRIESFVRRVTGRDAVRFEGLSAWIQSLEIASGGPSSRKAAMREYGVR